MAPKKKGNKKGQDDWEAELGESVDATAPADAAPKGEAAEDEDVFAGGLMGQINRKGKKGKKNKQQQDFVEGEDPAAESAAPNGESSLAAKAPEEANMEEDDVWSAPVPVKKPQDNKKIADDDEEEEAGGTLKTKKEKEKEKKEREKQRKKEQVWRQEDDRETDGR